MKELGTPSSTSKGTVQFPEFRFWLQDQFTQRCKQNPRYSLRAFANLLKMDASTISQILAGKRKASTKVIQQICQALAAHPDLVTSFSTKARSQFVIDSGVTDKGKPEYSLVAHDAFVVISDWHHFAILELLSIPQFSASPNACARALHISVTEAKIAIERMLRLGLLEEQHGEIIRTKKILTTFEPGFTSSAHKSLQKQILQMALHAIDNTPAEKKDVTAMTMAIDTSKLEEARKIITKFRREMSRFLEDGKQTQVYQLAIQLYPISDEIKN